MGQDSVHWLKYNSRNSFRRFGTDAGTQCKRPDSSVCGFSWKYRVWEIVCERYLHTVVARLWLWIGVPLTRRSFFLAGIFLLRVNNTKNVRYLKKYICGSFIEIWQSCIRRHKNEKKKIFGGKSCFWTKLWARLRKYFFGGLTICLPL